MLNVIGDTNLREFAFRKSEFNRDGCAEMVRFSSLLEHFQISVFSFSRIEIEGQSRSPRTNMGRPF